MPAEGDAIDAGTGSSPGRPVDQRIAVLVVDDAAVIRRVVVDHLDRRGFLAIPAESGEAALAALSVRRFDLLITDLQMPGMGGEALLGQVQDQYPMMRRIVMTGYTTIHNALAALKLGALGFIPKPIDPAELDALADLAVAEIRGWRRQLNAIRRLHQEGG